MAQTQSHQLPPRTFSPPVSTPSPGAQSPVTTGIAPPPKRQRLSPHPQSPHNSPHFGTLQLPPNGNSANGVPVNGMAKPVSNAPPPPGSMGPPSRPVEKATDAADLTDVLASSGIDVKEEEAFLTNGYGKSQPQGQLQPQPQPSQQAATTQPPPLQTNFSTSFNSLPSAGSAISAGGSFSEQSSKPLIPHTPTFSPSVSSPVPVKKEEDAKDEKLRQDTDASRREQYHLQAAFLRTALVEKALEKRVVEHGVKLPVYGVFRPFPGHPTGPVEVTGPDGSSVVRRDKTILTPDSTLGDIISLLSLASEERLRSVVDHSVTLSRNRRINSHGTAPPEWNDVVSVPENTDGEPSNSGAVSKNTVAKDNEVGTASFSMITKGTNSGLMKARPSTLALKSRRLIDRDVSYEEGRAAKRAKRNSDAILAGDGKAPTPGTSTPNGQAAERAPDIEKKSLKKDIKKVDTKATGAVQHQHAVETARMQTNSLASRFGKKGYSWLRNSQPAASRSGFASPSRVNSTTTAGSAAPTTEKPGAPTNARSFRKQFGDWREDKEHGAGIQIRDILFTLEVDGRSVKHLQKAYSKDTKEESGIAK